MNFKIIATSSMILLGNLVFAQTSPNPSKIACDQLVLTKLVEKGFMNKNICYSFDLKKNKMDVVINGAIYKLGDYSLDGTRKVAPVMQSFKPEVETDKKTPLKTSDPIGESNVKKVTDALNTLGIFVKQIAAGITQPISVKVNGYADGVRNSMQEFDDPNKESDPAYKEALKESATVDEAKSKVLSLVRNDQLALYRAKVHLDYLKKQLPANVSTSALGESSPELTTGKLGCQGYCKYRRGAKIEITIPGLEEKFDRSPEEMEVTFHSFRDFNSVLKATTARHLSSIMASECSIFTNEFCNKLDVKNVASLEQKVLCAERFFYGYQEKVKLPEYGADVKLIRECLASPSFAKKTYGLSDNVFPEIMDYATNTEFHKVKSKLSKLTTKDLKIAQILQMEGILLTTNNGFYDPNIKIKKNIYHTRQQDDLNSYLYLNVADQIAENLQSYSDISIEIKKKDPSARNPYLKPIGANTDRIMFDVNKLDKVFDPWVAGFIHFDCGSGVGITKNSSSFSMRTYHILSPTARHWYPIDSDPAKSSDDWKEANNALSKLYDVFNSNNLNFKPTNLFTLQHPTAYVIKDCQNCGCMNNITGEKLSSILENSPRLNFSSEFTLSSNKFPSKTISGIKKLTQGKNSCLFLAPVFTAHTKAGGSGTASEPKEIAIPEDASCQELVKLIDKMQPVSKTVDSTDSVIKHCTTYSGTNFPWTQNKCLECTKKVPIIDCKQTEMLDVTPGSFCD